MMISLTQALVLLQLPFALSSTLPGTEVFVAAQDFNLPNIKITLPARILNMSLGWGHAATYIDSSTGLAFDVAAENFSGEPSIVEIDSSTYSPKTSFTTNSSALAFDNNDKALQGRDVCGAVARCTQYVASTATAGSIFVANAFTSSCEALGSAAWHYFRRDGYANLNTVVQGLVVGFAVNFISVPIGNIWVNSLNKKSGGGSDSCAVNERENLADNFAASLNFFCQTIAMAKKAETKSHYYTGDMNDRQDRMTGQYSSTKAFIAERAGEYVGICREMGVEWKRALNGHGVDHEDEW